VVWISTITANGWQAITKTDFMLRDQSDKDDGVKVGHKIYTTCLSGLWYRPEQSLKWFLLIGKEQNSCSQSKERIGWCCGQEGITCKDNNILLRASNCIETGYKLELIGQLGRDRIVSSCFACCGTGLSP
jgi:hypothetical protein